MSKISQDLYMDEGIAKLSDRISCWSNELSQVLFEKRNLLETVTSEIY